MNSSELSWFMNQIMALEIKLQNDQRKIQHQLIEKDRIIESLKTIETPLCKNCNTSKSSKSVQTDDLLIASISTSDDDVDFENQNNFLSNIRRSKRFNKNSSKKFTKYRNITTNSKKLKSAPTLSSPIFNDYLNAVVFHNNKKSTEFPKNDEDCWYASDSASDSAGVCQKQKSINEARNPVLECVNQIILQQNIDVCLESDASPHKTSNSLQTKQVHFSINEQNLNDQVKPPAQTSVRIDNEYELIETLDNYLEMKSKKNLIYTVRKTPPNLPPKPANLMRPQQIPKQKKQFVDDRRTIIDSSESEQDNLYCSIGEIQETSKCIKIVAEIHETVCLDKKIELADALPVVNFSETFSDVPKLPNVAEIISPKSTTTYVKEKQVTKSPVKPRSFFENMKPPPNKTRVTTDNNIVTTNTTITNVNFSDKNQLEAEFEFFNLDAEYDKNHLSNDTSRLKKNTENSDHNIKKIEYKLDMEFSIK